MLRKTLVKLLTGLAINCCCVAGGSGQGTDAAAGSSVGSSETSCVTLGVAVASSIILFVYESHSDRREAGTTPHVDLMVQCSIAIRSLRQTLILAVVPTHTSFS